MSLTEIENLQRKVRQSIFYAAGLVLVVISVFMIKVWLLSDNQLSSNAEKWGQFGDYVGGILNPLMAFLAFYWLTQSVLIQKQELMDTKKALQESTQAQLKQEIHAGKTARISAYNSLLVSLNTEITILSNDAAYLRELLPRAGNVPTYDLNGSYQDNADGINIPLQKILEEINLKKTEKEKVFEQIKMLLEKSS